MADSKKILVAADPYAVSLRDAVVAHLKSKGYEVTDFSTSQGKACPYFEGAVAVCKALQAGEAGRAILFCGTGMGMSIVANRFKGCTASVVESVYAAKMCRAINNANVLCLGQMIWGADMAKAAVDVFLNTKFTEGLEGLSDFLRDACEKVEAIRP
jgi:ribose 5-phosphate isomerase B